MVEPGNKQVFIKHFKDLMSVDVKSIVVVDTLISHVEPSGELPVGFVLMENDKWFLVGWTDRRKRCHPQNLYPHRKKEILLYSSWTKKTWTYRQLYKCVFQRMRQLDDFPSVVSSVLNWEDNRQALYSCAKLLEDEVLQRVVKKELELLQHIVEDNDALLKSICFGLGIEVDEKKLLEHVNTLYRKELLLDKDAFQSTGLLTSVKEHVLSKWNI